ncbi:Fe-S cluster assembly scaffold protein NifU [Fontisphaera persica]|uniref:Fe-S cluster assembly scaffold protein NifU n=1 Tax=Fontisphaera persica TaxID=2974023 RepID=UPI0024C0B224|nr:Fe-S cluster assembly scaffold protein NifU [Fontisphaera persica]WCJ58909.1 Fe-S cluster assembly scaffold protein NifU [Fontisphaera persica]
MSETYTLYGQTVMDHFMNPRNMGDLPDADGVGEVGAAACGDIMKISLKIQDGKITDARFKTFGCGSAIASSSMATELIKGRTVEEALNFSNQEVVDALGGLPPVKIHCSVLAEEALKAALEDYLKKHPDVAAKVKEKEAARSAAPETANA